MSQPDFSKGLVPTIAQDAATGAVLMIAYINETAWEATLATGFAHFWSRSRQELWQKGATSGNTLRVESWALDCDRDAVLLQVTADGPACHTGSTSCFDAEPSTTASVLGSLERVIVERAAARPSGSYTTELLDGGPEGAGRKLVEEATEVLLAAKDDASGLGEQGRVAEEAADLVYHLLVTLVERGLSLRDVTAVLAERSQAGRRKPETGD